MSIKYTNDFTLTRNILKTEYTFILTLLFTNFNEIIHLLKDKNPLQGEILEYLYSFVPTYFNTKSELICEEHKYIDSILRIIYKSDKRYINNILKKDIKDICHEFHIKENDFEYYYCVALFIISLETNININAYNLYSQLNDNIKIYIDNFKYNFINNLNKYEFQCLFYNHLEDVYRNNISYDNKVSFIHKNNYSYFLSNLSINSLFHQYIKKIENKMAPIVITDEFIYNIIDNKFNILQTNTINAPIFNENIKYIATYYYEDHTIKNWIPFFNYFYEFNDLSNDICLPFYNDYILEYNIEDINSLNKSENFYIYDNDISHIHYYIDQFTIYSTNLMDNQEV